MAATNTKMDQRVSASEAARPPLEVRWEEEGAAEDENRAGLDAEAPCTPPDGADGSGPSEGGAFEPDGTCEDVGVDATMALTDDNVLDEVSGHNIDLGRVGEEAAASFLDRRGYEIVARNWKCIAGEADIIARDGDAVVFVEVKTRTGIDKGLPSEAVDARKRERYERIAALFLQDYDVVDVPVRFDVISIVALGTNRAFVRHHINAFGTGA